MDFESKFLRAVILQALNEDLFPSGDLSTAMCLAAIREKQAPSKQNEQQTSNKNSLDTMHMKAEIKAKEPGILAGSYLVNEILEIFCEQFWPDKDNPNIYSLEMNKKDGDKLAVGDIVGCIKAPAYIVLCCERSILNFMQRLSGIATFANELVNLIPADSNSKLLDTRKTSPGMRLLEKRAFESGGGNNHRINLSSMIMLKENHLKLASETSVPELVSAMAEQMKKQSISREIVVEINKENLAYLNEICTLGVDQIMLDNFSVDEIARVKEQIPSDIKVEVSGNISKENIADYAKTNVDFISTSAASTKSKWLDLSMLVEVLETDN